jgi:3-oxoacyl-[acyl-carrier protein] reductase
MITGAGSNIGLGQSMTLALVRAGARVAMVDIDENALLQTANDMREIGGDNAVMTLVGDVSSPDSTSSMVEQAVDQMGGVDILINNAGTNPWRSGLGDGMAANFWEASPEAWNRVISVNFTGPFLMSRAVVEHMMGRGWGRIIGVTTSMDTMYRAKGAPYGPSKAGHEALMATMAQELEGTGVTANVLVPGGMANTNLLAPGGPDRDGMIQPVVMQGPVVWLASEASNGINGRRFIAFDWDESLPLEERIEKAGAPVAWPQLGQQSRRPSGA